MASFETVALTPAEPPAAPRPRRAPPRDISLHHARLDNALRHIAEAGGFNLVVASDLAEPVTVELRGVEPYDALVAVANAHGVALRYERGIVVATR